jgi:pimeloyl-ACP methyl ester carboxylesterase
MPATSSDIRAFLRFDGLTNSSSFSDASLAMNPRLEREIAGASLSDNTRRAVSSIIRPHRSAYDPDERYEIDGLFVPVRFVNRRGLSVIGSLYLTHSFSETMHRTCVIYLHGNCGSQREGRSLAHSLLAHGVSLFCFDFTGSGLSGGEYVGLGSHEHLDTLDAIHFLTSQFSFSSIVLWGRSMGAAAALMAAPHSEAICGIIVDSAFASLHELFLAIAERTPIPRFLQPFAIWWIKREVGQLAQFDCNEVNPATAGRASKVAMLLGHAQNDDFVPWSHALTILKEYGADDKELVPLDGSHNTPRNREWIVKCMQFIMRVLGVVSETTSIIEIIQLNYIWIFSGHGKAGRATLMRSHSQKIK